MFDAPVAFDPGRPTGTPTEDVRPRRSFFVAGRLCTIAAEVAPVATGEAAAAGARPTQGAVEPRA